MRIINFLRIIRTKSTLSMQNIQTYVFLDLETTGLPSLEHNRTKITEMSMVAVLKDHISLGVIPRVQNKLNLCFNPRRLVSSEAEKVTGLSNEILERIGCFSSKTIQTINLFLDHNPKPICLVAHNGDTFDFPIFKAAIHKTGSNLIEGLLCVDSLKMFRELDLEDKDTPQLISNPKPVTSRPQKTLVMEYQNDLDEELCKALDEYEQSEQKRLTAQQINEKTPTKRNVEQVKWNDGTVDSNWPTPKKKQLKTTIARRKINYGTSFKLIDVYERLTHNKALDAHKADSDAIMLLFCAATLGDRFVNWANGNANNFSDIPAMVPGKKCGQR